MWPMCTPSLTNIQYHLTFIVDIQLNAHFENKEEVRT